MMEEPIEMWFLRVRLNISKTTKKSKETVSNISCQMDTYSQNLSIPSNFCGNEMGNEKQKSYDN